MMMDVTCRVVRARNLAVGHGTRSRVVAKAVDSETVTRRDGIVKSVCLLGAGLLMALEAEARSDPYYDELLNSTKGLDSADLLSKYKKMSSSEGGKKQKKRTTKREKKGGSGRGSSSATFSKAGQGSPAGSAINPVEVGFGLAGLAGVVAIGQQGSKGGASSGKKAPSSPKPKPKPQKKAAAGTVRLSPGPTKKVATPGTQKKVATSGTQRKVGTQKRVGTVTKKVQGARSVEEKSSNGAAPALLVGLVAVIGAFVAVGSKPTTKDSMLTKEPVVEKVTTAKESSPVADVPVVAAPPVETEKEEKPAAPVASVEEKRPSPSKSKLPPTTGNSPIVLIGGSIATLIVAAAVAGGSENSSTEAKVDTPASSDDDAALRKKEAREWIEAWRARQK